MFLLTDVLTTTQQPSKCWPNNPCQNSGVCRLSKNDQFHTCFCKSNYDENRSKFKCSHCDKQFLYKTNLAVHIR